MTKVPHQGVGVTKYRTIVARCPICQRPEREHDWREGYGNGLRCPDGEAFWTLRRNNGADLRYVSLGGGR